MKSIKTACQMKPHLAWFILIIITIILGLLSRHYSRLSFICRRYFMGDDGLFRVQVPFPLQSL